MIGEGAGTLVLEEYEHAVARGAKIYAEVIGFASNCDAAHVTQPQMETMQICMEMAMQTRAFLLRRSTMYLLTALPPTAVILQKATQQRMLWAKCQSVHSRATLATHSARVAQLKRG